MAATSECHQHINSLPIGVLQEIFSYLPLEDRKTAALMCRLWEHEAFSVRLLANVRLRLHHCENPTILKVLQNSSRMYRNIRVCDNLAWGDVLFEFIVTVLDKYGPAIEEFIMAGPCMAAQLKAFVGRMPNLKKLVAFVRVDIALQLEPLKFPILSMLHDVDLEYYGRVCPLSVQYDILDMSPNVQRLTISNNCNDMEMSEILKRYACQLRSLHVTSCFHMFSTDELRFENLVVLKVRVLSHNTDGDRMYHLFRGLRELKAAHLDFFITRATMTAVCDSCPKLETLEINATCLEGELYNYLLKLPNLRVIIIKLNTLHPQ